MTDQERTGPGALPEDATDDDAASTELDPSSSQSQDTPPAPEEEPDLRQIQAQHGRELAETRRRAEAPERTTVSQAQQIQALNTQLGQVTNYLTAQQQREAERAKAQRDAYLNSLTPDKRANEEIRLLKADVAALQQRPAVAARPPAQGSTESDVDYTARRSRELIDAINRDAGLTGENALTGNEEELDWDDERGFIGSARTLARLRSKGIGTVAKNQNGSSGAGSGGSNGASRPLNARPVGGGGRKVDAAAEANGVFARNANPRGGVKKKKEALDEIRKRAHDALPRSAR